MCYQLVVLHLPGPTMSSSFSHTAIVIRRNFESGALWCSEVSDAYEFEGAVRAVIALRSAVSLPGSVGYSSKVLTIQAFEISSVLLLYSPACTRCVLDHLGHVCREEMPSR